MIRRICVAAGVLMILASPASAKMVSADNGAVVVRNGGTAERVFYVKDAKADGNSVHGNYSWSNGKGGTLNNKSGNGTIVYRDTGRTISAIQACVDYGTFEPDACSRWI